MSQILIENIFEKHVNWIDLIKNMIITKIYFRLRFKKCLKLRLTIEIEVDPETDINGCFLCLDKKFII